MALISLPDQLLKRIDAEAGPRSISRSGLLREAVSREIVRPDSQDIDAAIERLRTSFAKLGADARAGGRSWLSTRTEQATRFRGASFH